MSQPETDSVTISARTLDANVSESTVDVVRPARKGATFWFAFVAIIMSSLLSALDLTAVSTVLPTITNELDGGDNFVWVGSAYALACAAFLPLSGNFADVFGRRPIMLLSIVFFAVGSAVSGSAHSMNIMIVGRTIQGVGGGGIVNMSDIIISDIVPLAERGLYQGILALTWSFASGIGPPIGGALATSASWRWLFYLNLPLTGVAFLLVMIFLRIKMPEGSISRKLMRVDWIGNLIVISGTTLAIIGMTWGGVRYSWSSPKVLAPLIIGLPLIALFILFDIKVPREPTLPLDVLSNRTTVSGLLATAIHGVVSIAVIYYLPVYFQACLLATPMQSGVDLLASAFIMSPSALIAGIVIQKSSKYRFTVHAGWMISIVGFGLLSLLQYDSPARNWVGFQIVVSMGIGILFSATMFPVLAPLSISRTAAALAFYAFLRSFAQTWGITITSTILQNELNKKLPSEFFSLFPELQGSSIAYAAIPLIPSLPQPIQDEVRMAFASSMRVVWLTMAGISGLGLLSGIAMEEVPMGQQTDERYGLNDGEKIDIEEFAMSSQAKLT